MALNTFRLEVEARIYAACANRRLGTCRQMPSRFSKSHHLRQYGLDYAPGFSSEVSPMSSTSASTSACGTDDISIL